MLHVYILVSIDTLAQTLNTFVEYLFEFQTVEGIGYTFILMPGHFVTLFYKHQNITWWESIHS